MKNRFIVLLAIPLATAFVQGCSSQREESPRAAASRTRAEHDQEAAKILADIHKADPSFKMAENAVVNKRGQLKLQVNRAATESELKPLATFALKRLIQSYPGPKAALLVVGPSGRRIATARLDANGNTEFFDPRQTVRRKSQ